MHPDIFWKAFTIGLIATFPIGPIGIYCFKQIVEKGALLGFIASLGSSCADALFALAAFSSFYALSASLATYRLPLQIIGAAVIFFMGAKFILAKKRAKELKGHSRTVAKDFFYTFFITLSNPASILVIIALMAALRVGDASTPFAHTRFSLGVFLGSATWWVLIAAFTHQYKKLFLNRKALRLIAGTILISLSVVCLFNAFSYMP